MDSSVEKQPCVVKDTEELRAALTTLENLLKRRYYHWDGREQFNGTGERLVRAFNEFCWPPEQIESEVAKHASRVFNYSIDEMLVEGPIEAWTLCPHHLLPCKFIVYIGYIPDGAVLGLSKFARIATTLGKRPVIQEQYTQELADVIQKYLKPRGVGVAVFGQHGCMQSRGIKQQANVSTAILHGVIRERPEARAEFYALVRERNGKQ